jgi:hypothetical protein
MAKSLVMFALAGMMSAPGVAQTAPATNPSTTVNQIQPAKPQVVKKRVCQMVEDEDPYSRLGTRKICHTIEVKEPVQVPADGQQPSTERGTSGR